MANVLIIIVIIAVIFIIMAVLGWSNFQNMIQDIEKEALKSCVRSCNEVGYDYFRYFEGGLFGSPECSCKNLNKTPVVIQVW